MYNRFSAPLLGTLAILSISLLSEGSATKKTATPGEGNNAAQTIQVDSPYCDAYAPYKYSGDPDRVVTQLLDPLKFNFNPALPNDHDEISRFLDLKLTIGSPITKSGAFSDPGYPLFGDANRHLYSDGTDIQRLLLRLFATDNNSGKHLTTPLCLDPSGKTFADSAATLNSNAQVRRLYYLIHIVRWERSGGTYQTAESSWYVFNRTDAKAAHRQVPFTFHPYTTGDLRIFGSSNVFFIAIHLAPIGAVAKGSVQPGTASQDYTTFRNAVNISYKLAVTKIEPANIQDLKALLGVITKLAPSGEAAAPASSEQLAAYMAFVNNSQTRPYAGVYGAAVLAGLEHLPVQVISTMTATLPPADKTATNLAKYEDHSESEILSAAAKQQVSPNPQPAPNTPAQTQKGAPSTTTAAPSQQSSSSNTATSKVASTTTGCTYSANGSCVESAVVQNEGLAWWDVSIGVPFKGYKELQYSSGSLTPKTVSKGSAYGFVVVAPWKEDIVSPPSLGIPHLLVGLPLQGKVFNAPVFAMGETMNIASVPKLGPALAKLYPVGVRLYCGVVYNKQFAAPIAGVSPTPSHRVTKLQYGIEFSVRSIASKLSTTQSSTKPATSAKKTSSP